jgi:hypothetical protein
MRFSPAPAIRPTILALAARLEQINSRRQLVLKIPNYQYVCRVIGLAGRDVVLSKGGRVGETMVAARRIIALTIDPEQRQALVDISRSRTEATSRVERSRITLANLDEPSAYAVAVPGASRGIGGVGGARRPRPDGTRSAVFTPEAQAWLVSLACAKPIAFGYPHELWTTRLLAAHARDHGPQAGHPCLSKRAQGTVCKGDLYSTQV